MRSAPQNHPATQSPLTILSKITGQYEEILSEKGKKLHLQSGARRVLFCLLGQDNVSQLTIVRATHLKAPTISLIVQKMEKDGLVTRKTDEIDMRLTRVSLTPEGRKAAENLKVTVDSVLTAAMKDFSQKDSEQLAALLSRISSNLEEYTER